MSTCVDFNSWFGGLIYNWWVDIADNGLMELLLLTSIDVYIICCKFDLLKFSCTFVICVSTLCHNRKHYHMLCVLHGNISAQRVEMGQSVR